jgi:hypothetical protein
MQSLTYPGKKQLMEIWKYMHDSQVSLIRKSMIKTKGYLTLNHMINTGVLKGLQES